MEIISKLFQPENGKNGAQKDVKIGVEEENDEKLFSFAKKKCCHLKSSCFKK